MSAGVDQPYEGAYLHAFETGSELRVGLARWVGRNNADWPRSAIGGRPPGGADGTANDHTSLAA